MFKKTALVVIGVSIASLAFSGLALAQEGTPALGSSVGALWHGMVTAVGANSITIENRRGETRTIYVDSNTTYADKDGNTLSLSYVTIGGQIGGTGATREDGKFYATTVYIRNHYQGVGVVTTVGDDSFNFTNRRGKDWEFYVDSNTQFTDRQGNTLSFSDVKSGSKLFVEAELHSDGKWWATVVRMKPASAAGGAATTP